MSGASIPRLQNFYKKEVVPRLMEEFSFKNVIRAPKLEKIVLNIGLGEAVANPKAMESGVEALTQICGQKPMITKAKKTMVVKNPP